MRQPEKNTGKEGVAATTFLKLSKSPRNYDSTVSDEDLSLSNVTKKAQNTPKKTLVKKKNFQTNSPTC